MRRTIPILLFDGSGLVKTTRFKSPSYVGDILNVVRIFNDKCVDELVILDISEKAKKHGPNLEIMESVASECFMPVAYGGGIRTVEDCAALFKAGFEKVSFNSAAISHPSIVSEAVRKFGSQAVIVSIDADKKWFGRGWGVRNPSNGKLIKVSLTEYLNNVQELGVGEVLITSVRQEGTMLGYDEEMLNAVKSFVRIPAILNGGAASIGDFQMAFDAGMTGAGGGAIFVYQGTHRGVLISYPSEFVEENWS